MDIIEFLISPIHSDYLFSVYISIYLFALSIFESCCSVFSSQLWLTPLQRGYRLLCSFFPSILSHLIPLIFNYCHQFSVPQCVTPWLLHQYILLLDFLSIPSWCCTSKSLNRQLSSSSHPFPQLNDSLTHQIPRLSSISLQLLSWSLAWWKRGLCWNQEPPTLSSHFSSTPQ